jgi:hypothetical protein
MMRVRSEKPGAKEFLILSAYDSADDCESFEF